MSDELEEDWKTDERRRIENQPKENYGNCDGHQQAGKQEQMKQERTGNSEKGPHWPGVLGWESAMWVGQVKVIESHIGEGSQRGGWWATEQETPDRLSWGERLGRAEGSEQLGWGAVTDEPPLVPPSAEKWLADEPGETL